MSSSSTSAKKTVVFCVPGRTFSNNFLQSWTETLHELVTSGRFNVLLSNHYSSCVHIARARCLGLSVERGPSQKPWNGEVAYDVLVWIDSDMVFRSRDVLDLIQFFGWESTAVLWHKQALVSRAKRAVKRLRQTLRSLEGAYGG